MVASVSVEEILQRPWQPQPAALELTDSDSDDDEAEDRAEQERTGAVVAAAASRFRMLRDDDDVRLLPFQGAEVEVVLLAGRRVVAFDTVARRRREAALPVSDQPTGSTDWFAAAFAAHTNTLALVAPVVLMEPPDDQENS